MPMADQPRLPTGVTNIDTGGQCRTCGCLNFSLTEDECSTCIGARQGQAGSVRRHPFLPTVRLSNGTTSAPPLEHGARRSTPSLAAASGQRPVLSVTSTPTHDAPSAKENTNHHVRGVASAAFAVHGMARPHANGRANGSNGGTSPLRNTTTIVREQAMKTDASEVTVAKAIRPGSSLLAPSPSSSSAANAGTKRHDSTPASTASSSSAAATSVSVAAMKANQSSARDKRTRKSREVIDLISSDEESEDHQRRAAKRARQAARMQQSNARLALHNVDVEEEEDVSMVTPDSEKDEKIRPSHPPQGRRFGAVEFDDDDFPSAAELAQIMRGRSTSSVINSTASTAVSTPTSVSSAAPPPPRVSASVSLSSTAPTTMRVTTAATTRTTTVTTITSTASVVIPPRDNRVPSATSNAGVIALSAPVLQASPTTNPRSASPTSENSSTDVPMARSQSVPSLDVSASLTTSQTVIPQESPASVGASAPPVKTTTVMATSRPTPSSKTPKAAVATAQQPVPSLKTAQAVAVSRSMPPVVTHSAVATSQPVPTLVASAAVATSPPVSSLPTPAAATISQPVPPLQTTTAVVTSQPVSQLESSTRTTSQLVPLQKPTAAVAFTQLAPTTVRAAHPTLASQNPIVLDDCDDESDEEKSDDSEPALFQSRRFQSIVLNARDFVTANDGLNLARRSSTIAQLPTSPVATDASVTSSTSPTRSIESALRPTSGAATTTKPAHEQAPSVSTAIRQPNVLEARRKPPLIDPLSIRHAEASTILPATIKIELSSPQRSAAVRRIIKPTLGHCSTDFLGFMHDCIDSDDQDEDEDELAMAKLLEVVDLTNLSDDSVDDDDDDDDYFEIIEAATQPSATQSTASGGLRVGASSALITGLSTSIKENQVVPGENGLSQTVAPVIKRTRAPRPKETCAICEEKAWIRALVQCPDCKKYYHKKCAREYGDENVCYICDADGIIDDSELTDEHKNELIGLLGAFRQSSDSETGDDGDDEGAEERSDMPVVVDQATLLRTVATTKSTRRWREFLNVSTAPMEESFNRVTSQISQELADEERKRRYSRGFVRKEEFEKDMTEVLDHYAGLQDREERRLREDRSRAPQTEVVDVNGADAADIPAKPDPPAVQTTAERPIQPEAAPGSATSSSQPK